MPPKLISTSPERPPERVDDLKLCWFIFFLSGVSFWVGVWFALRPPPPLKETAMMTVAEFDEFWVHSSENEKNALIAETLFGYVWDPRRNDLCFWSTATARQNTLPNYISSRPFTELHFRDLERRRGLKSSVEPRETYFKCWFEGEFALGLTLTEGLWRARLRYHFRHPEIPLPDLQVYNEQDPPL